MAHPLIEGLIRQQLEHLAEELPRLNEPWQQEGLRYRMALVPDHTRAMQTCFERLPPGDALRAITVALAVTLSEVIANYDCNVQRPLSEDAVEGVLEYFAKMVRLAPKHSSYSDPVFVRRHDA